jgi:ATP-binding cassette, subfamily C (CFTR/MRP), member 1
MIVIDAEIPYALLDLSFSTRDGDNGVLMCLSAGYFAATLPPVILAIWVCLNEYPSNKDKY